MARTSNVESLPPCDATSLHERHCDQKTGLTLCERLYRALMLSLTCIAVEPLAQ